MHLCLKLIPCAKTSLKSTFTNLRSDGLHQDSATSRESGTSSTRLEKSQYRLREDVEGLEDNALEVYYPLQTGDESDCGRYWLVHKPGYGGYSTIWLARDLQRARYWEWRSLLFNTSGCSPETSFLYSFPEVVIHAGVGDYPTSHRRSLNGKHRCIVTSPAQMLVWCRRGFYIGAFSAQDRAVDYCSARLRSRIPSSWGHCARRYVILIDMSSWIF